MDFLCACEPYSKWCSVIKELALHGGANSSRVVLVFGNSLYWTHLGFRIENCVWGWGGNHGNFDIKGGPAKNSQCNQLTINKEIISYFNPCDFQGGGGGSRPALSPPPPPPKWNTDIGVSMIMDPPVNCSWASRRQWRWCNLWGELLYHHHTHVAHIFS